MFGKTTGAGGTATLYHQCGAPHRKSFRENSLSIAILIPHCWLGIEDDWLIRENVPGYAVQNVH
jgi:hypothetical protein